MRIWRRVVLVAAAAAWALAASCGGDTFSSGDALADGGVDGSSAGDAAPPGDGGVVASDAADAGPWCATKHPRAIYCNDFDETIDPTTGLLTFGDPAIRTLADAATSAPHALEIGSVPGDGGKRPGLYTTDFPQPKVVRFGFSTRLLKYAKYMEIATVRVAAGTSEYELTFATYVLTNGDVELSFQERGSNGSDSGSAEQQIKIVPGGALPVGFLHTEVILDLGLRPPTVAIVADNGTTFGPTPVKITQASAIAPDAGTVSIALFPFVLDAVEAGVVDFDDVYVTTP